MTFSANYEILLTAQARHDIGIYLSTDGTDALLGSTCTILALPAPQVTLEWSHQRGGVQSLSLRQTTADANGFFAFTQVGLGLHALSVAAPGFESAQLRVESPGDLVLQLNHSGQSNDGN